MIIIGNQVSLNNEARFEFIYNNMLLMQGAGTRVLNITKSYLNNPDSTQNLILSWHAVGEMINQIPGKWFFDDCDHNVSFIRDIQNNIVGRIYHRQEQLKLLTTYFCIDFGQISLKVYEKHKGKTNYLAVYQGETQIAMITRSNFVKDGLDKYFIYILSQFDSYRNILMLFALYYDNYNYGNQLQVKKGSEVSLSFTMSATDKYINFDWITNNFSAQELVLVNQLQKENEQNVKSGFNLKNFFKNNFKVTVGKK